MGGFLRVKAGQETELANNVGAVADLEGEARVGVAVGVGGRCEAQLVGVEVGLAHHLVGGDRGAVEGEG